MLQPHTHNSGHNHTAGDMWICPLAGHLFSSSCLHVDSYHNAVGLADGPDVDPAVLSSGGQQAARAFPKRQTGNPAGVSLELLCKATQQGPNSAAPLDSHSSDQRVRRVYSRSRHDIFGVLVLAQVLAAAMLVTTLLFGTTQRRQLCKHNQDLQWTT